MIIDFHSHILPGADHGSDNLETSLKQIKKAKEIGIDVIVSTSHYYQHNETVEHFLKKRDKCYEKLQEALKKENIDIKIIKGAEVTLEVGLADNSDLSKLCIEGTNKILIEMPMDERWTDWVYNSVYEIGAKHRITPIIAHIDRYEEKQLNKLLEMKVLCQVNATSLCNLLKRRRILNYIKSAEAQFIGSDVHGAEAVQYEHFEKALKYIGAKNSEIVMANSKKTLNLSQKCETEQSNEGLIF